MPVVVSVGGSLLGDVSKRPPYLRDLARTLRATRPRPLYVTTGGGPIARELIAAGRSLGLSERALDLVGIQATRLNAQLLAAALKANREIPESEAAAVHLGRRGGIVVMGGTAPGWTTDAVAARLAVATRASRLVNATAVDGVYTADPRRDPRARRLDHVTFAELRRLVGARHTRAGPNVVFDPVAARIVARHRVPVLVVDGRELSNLRAAIDGRAFRGTRVGP